MKFNGDGPVVGLDVDGSMGDYHGHFLRFAEGWLGREMPAPEDINPGLPLHRHMGTAKATYRKVKWAYRQGGLKRSMPCYPGARELTVDLRKAGAENWICTSRPYLQHGPIEPDTRHWLWRNRIQYDHILWGEHKYRDLRKLAPGRVVFVLEDLPEMAEQAIACGIPVLLRDQPYNRWWDPDGILARRVHDLIEAREFGLRLLQEWKQRRA
jgi:hypothetical protein